MQHDVWFNPYAEPVRLADSTMMMLALFRCASCTTVEYANGALLSDFATLNERREWTTPCPICSDTAVLEVLIHFYGNNQIQIKRAGQVICLPISLIAPIAELASADLSGFVG